MNSGPFFASRTFPGGGSPCKRLRVIGRRKHSRLHRLDVGPHGDREAVTHEDAWPDPSLERGDRAVRLHQPPRELDFSLRARKLCQGCDSRDDVARRQVDDEPVGVAENDRVSDRQAER